MTGENGEAVPRGVRSAQEGAGTRAPEARWLDADELEAWIQVAMMLSRLPGELDAQLLRDSGLTHFEYEVLSVLSDSRDRRRRMSELAALAGGSVSRLSHVVKRLEKRGYVQRVPGSEDRRITYASLTDGGLSLVQQAAPGYVDNVRSLVIDRLSREQLDQLVWIGRRINEGARRIP